MRIRHQLTFSRFMTPSWLGGEGGNTAKITVNVWDFGPLGTAKTALQRGAFPTFPTTLNSPSRPKSQTFTMILAVFAPQPETPF